MHRLFMLVFVLLAVACFYEGGTAFLKTTSVMHQVYVGIAMLGGIVSLGIAIIIGALAAIAESLEAMRSGAQTPPPERRQEPHL